jgi:hypothetical protein
LHDSPELPNSLLDGQKPVFLQEINSINFYYRFKSYL